MENTFPYTETIPFFKLNSIRHGIMQIYPPSNWENFGDYFGFHATGDSSPYPKYENTIVDIYTKENTERETTIIIFKGHSFFINYKKSTIHLIPNTFKIEN